MATLIVNGGIFAGRYGNQRRASAVNGDEVTGLAEMLKDSFETVVKRGFVEDPIHVPQSGYENIKARDFEVNFVKNDKEQKEDEAYEEENKINRIEKNK